MRNPYEVLGASPLEGKDSIKAKYRKLAKLYHPDIAGEEGRAKFEEVQKAWDMISSSISAKTGFRWTHGSSVFDILKKEV